MDETDLGKGGGETMTTSPLRGRASAGGVQATYRGIGSLFYPLFHWGEQRTSVATASGAGCHKSSFACALAAVLTAFGCKACLS